MKTMLAIAMALVLGACSTHRVHCRGLEPINKTGAVRDGKGRTRTESPESHP